MHADHGRPLGRVVDDCIGNMLLQVRLLRQLASEFSSFASSPQARPEPTALAPLLDELLQPYVIALAGRIAIDAADAGRSARGAASTACCCRARSPTSWRTRCTRCRARGTLRGARRRSTSPAWSKSSVTDTGVGMDAAALARIFEPYFSTKATGTGLGLTIARRNVELNGGTIAVASTPGRGTTVTMQIRRRLTRRVAVVRRRAGGSDAAASAGVGAAARRLPRVTAHSTIGETR